MAASPSPTTTWPTPSRRSRSSAASTSPRYALCCFGGAGAQHACQVADLLGIGRCSSTPTPRSSPPTAWAWPSCACCARQAVEAAARRGRHRRAGGGRGRSGARRVRGVARTGRRTDARIAHRGARTSSAMPAPTPRSRCRWPSRRGMRAAFETEHRARYGFVVDGTRPGGRGGHGRGHRRHGGGRRAGACASSARDRTRWSPCCTTPLFTNRAPHQPAERFEAAVLQPRGAAAGRPGRRPGAGLRRRPPRSWSSPAGRSRSRRATI